LQLLAELKEKQEAQSMTALYRWLLHTKRLAFVLWIFAAFGASCFAQGLKEVEIEVAGPWSIAPDPRSSTGPARIVLIAPIMSKTNHQVDVHPGGDAYIYGNDITAGSYSLDFAFDRNNCKGDQHSKLQQFERVDNVAPTDILTAIQTPNNRYAISLPQPCYFETYSDSRAIVSSSTISDLNGEQRYTTWTKFHYWVAKSITGADSSGASDATAANPLPSRVRFSTGPNPPRSEALTIVLYDLIDQEDFDCDSHSATFFDASVVDLWNQKGLFRLFPELDGGHNQSLAYNFACNQIPGKGSMEEKVPSRSWIRKQIRSIRDALRSSNSGEIEEGMNKLKARLKTMWGQHLPVAITDDFAAVEKIEKFLKKEKATKFQSINADQYLLLTEHILTAGRTDCHSMQVNVNNAVS